MTFRLLAGVAATLVMASSGTAQQAPGPASSALTSGGRLLPERLADTGLYAPGGDWAVDARNTPFAPQYPLWSDGLTKRRWVYLPPGDFIDATNEHEWTFPVGTRFWKEFTLDGRKVETRFIWKAPEAGWVFASYLWNDAGTAATLADDKGVPGVADLGSGRRHTIPSRTDCTACHATRAEAPLGFTALQLSPDRDPNAVHGESLAPGMIALPSLVERHQIAPVRTEWIETPLRIRARDPETRAVLGYLAANCGPCHNGRGEIAALGPVIRPRDLVEDGDAVARGLVGHATKWQVPGLTEGSSVLVDPTSPETSAILVRMRSRRPSSQMPPLGTVLRDDAAVHVLTHWIRTQSRRP